MSSRYSSSSQSSRSSEKTLEGTIANLQGIGQFEKPINILDGKIKLYEIENTKNSHSSSSYTELSLLPTPHFLVIPDSENRDFNSNRLSVPTSSFIDPPIVVFDNNTELNSNSFHKKHIKNSSNSYSCSSKKSSDEETLKKKVHEESFYENSCNSLESELSSQNSCSRSSKSNSDCKIDDKKNLRISSEDFGNYSKANYKAYIKSNKKDKDLDETSKNEKKKHGKVCKTEDKRMIQAEILAKRCDLNNLNEKDILRDNKKPAQIKIKADKPRTQTRKARIWIAYKIVINLMSMISTPILLPFMFFDILQYQEELSV
ncbi:hypothetical protein SteCoe_11643 [Stentor coeruleus]|uniref:Uncharacterized protein n=1 Tax=Stentor coeruleus TaxID=5963 RepID=A0A1R2CCP8_9CILI|nr:hypothetical protein SteCoe_11643 [Stentor coeruleus]